jgi:hypothetical protein
MKIYRGKQTPEHKGDTSRELLSMWEESGYCEIIDGETNDVFLWVNFPGDVLLYEYDRYDVYPHLPPRWNKGLFGGMQHPNGFPWVYWGRHPRKLEAKINDGIKPYDEKNIDSLFLGKIENGIQLKNRTQHDWSTAIEVFSMPVRMGDSFTWPHTQDEYLEKVSQSKFGLCMPGYGPKCNREIELLGLGVIPLITDGVCTSYHEPLIEGKHFLRVRNPSHAKEVMSECSKLRWEYISHNGRGWYERNCSRKGSFEITLRSIC